MTMTVPYNLLAARKTIGAIHHRLAEANLDTAIRRRIILRQLQDLNDTLPVKKFGALIGRCIQAHNENDTLELVAGLSLIASTLPRLTYGCALQGQFFNVVPDDGVLWKKSKSGRVSVLSGVLYPHFAADQLIALVNE
jgi:hypothetical protein